MRDDELDFTIARLGECRIPSPMSGVRFTRAIADHCFKNYDGVLRVDGDVGDKKAYDPRPYMTRAENAMAARVVRATTELRSAGTTMAQ